MANEKDKGILKAVLAAIAAIGALYLYFTRAGEAIYLIVATAFNNQASMSRFEFFGLSIMALVIGYLASYIYKIKPWVVDQLALKEQQTLVIVDAKLKKTLEYQEDKINALTDAIKEQHKELENWREIFIKELLANKK